MVTNLYGIFSLNPGGGAHLPRGCERFGVLSFSSSLFPVAYYAIYEYYGKLLASETSPGNPTKVVPFQQPRATWSFHPWESALGRKARTLFGDTSSFAHYTPNCDVHIRLFNYLITIHFPLAENIPLLPSTASTGGNTRITLSIISGYSEERAGTITLCEGALNTFN